MRLWQLAGPSRRSTLPAQRTDPRVEVQLPVVLLGELEHRAAHALVREEPDDLLDREHRQPAALPRNAALLCNAALQLVGRSSSAAISDGDSSSSLGLSLGGGLSRSLGQRSLSRLRL